MTLRRVAQFELIECIGEGGMGEVFRAMDTMLEREVAIKALRPALTARPDLVERFRVEAIALAKLNHPNIAAVYSFLHEQDTYFMVMLFVRGHTLEEVLTRRTRLPWQEALGIVAQTLRALDHAHRLGVVHRDLKPANLMVRGDGSVVVMDFGIARVLARARQTRTGNMVGTLEYISPEQVQGKEVDGRADFYSLGVMLYEMLTGRLPFIADTEYDLLRAHVELTPPPARDLCRDLPEPVEQLVRKAMAKDPRQRFADAEQFLLAVEALLPAVSTRLTPAPWGGAGAGRERLIAPGPEGALARMARAASQAASQAGSGVVRLAAGVLPSGAPAGAGVPTGRTDPGRLGRLGPAGASEGSNAAVDAGFGAAVGVRPTPRWTDTAIVMAKRNPGVAAALLLSLVALVLMVAGAVGRHRQAALTEEPPGNDPVAQPTPAPAPAPVRTAAPTPAAPPSFPGITIVADRPNEVAPFPKAGELGAPGTPPTPSPAPPPTNAVVITPPGTVRDNAPPKRTAPQPAPPVQAAAPTPAPVPSPSPPPPPQKSESGWYVR